jgi:hypothetical protein
MSKEYTQEQVEKMFIDKIHQLVEYWANESSAIDAKKKLEGLAFSILATIDGSDVDLPAFILAPLPAEEDKEYHISNSRKYFPENHTAEISCDISGGLHDLYAQTKK